MSDASVQFVELIRRAAAGLPVSVQLLPGQRLNYCQNCGQETPHEVRDFGPICEKFTCMVCGSAQTYVVR